MIEIISNQGTEIEIPKPVNLKEPKLITRRNRSDWLRTKPEWFRQIMNKKSEKGRPNYKELEMMGDI